MIACRCHSFPMGCKIDQPPSGNGHTPKPRQMWGGDLCTTPVKELREPEAPRGDGLAISGPEGHSYLKHHRSRMLTNYWPRRAVCRLRTSATGSGEPPAKLPLPAAERVQRTENRGLRCIAAVWQGMHQVAKCSRAGKVNRRQVGCPHHRLVEQEKPRNKMETRTDDKLWNAMHKQE